MTEFGDIAFAAKLRDLTRGIARAEINRIHPPDQFGTIVDVDETARKARVVMPGSPEPQSVGYGFGDAPDTGVMVRITGRAGSRYIAGAGGVSAAVTNENDIVDGIGISDLDVASALDGTELVPIVQGGVTVQTTTQDIADLGGGGGLTVVHDSYLDGTGVDIGNGGKLAWVLDTGFLIGIAPNAELLDLSNPERPTVIADGYFTFDVFVAGENQDEPDQRLQWLLSRGSDVLHFGQKGFPLVSTGGLSNSTDFSFSYPCLAGDELFVQLQTASGSTRHYALAASVKRF